MIHSPGGSPRVALSVELLLRGLLVGRPCGRAVAVAQDPKPPQEVRVSANGWQGSARVIGVEPVFVQNGKSDS